MEPSTQFNTFLHKLAAASAAQPLPVHRGGFFAGATCHSSIVPSWANSARP